jgi:c-di-AMP phosphodiesterase-like protein
VNFATQYGTVQKQLLNDFEIPYALLDYNSRFLWMNEKFTEITGKDKNYHKSVTTVFPSLTKDILQKSEAVESINVMLDDRNFRHNAKQLLYVTRFKDRYL